MADEIRIRQTKQYRKVYNFKLSEDQVQAIAHALAAYFNVTARDKITISPDQAELLVTALQHMRQVTLDTKPVIMLKE